MEKSSLDPEYRTGGVSPESVHLTSIVLEDAEFMSPDPAGDSGGLKENEGLNST